jgi:hypothetical protein
VSQIKYLTKNKKIWIRRKLRGDGILVMLATIRSRTFCLLAAFEKRKN